MASATETISQAVSAMAVLAGFVNRAFALPGKLAEMDIIPLSKEVTSVLDAIGVWAFFIVISIFAVWVLGTFFKNINVLRGGNSEIHVEV